MAAVTVEDLKIYLKITDATQAPLLSMMLSDAEEEVLGVRYPFGYTDIQKTEALIQYAGIVRNIAAYLFNKIGAFGQTAHSVSGISRSYESGGIPPSFTARITPMARFRSFAEAETLTEEEDGSEDGGETP